MYPLERASCFSKGHVEAAGGQTGSSGHAAHCGARPVPMAQEMLCLTDLGKQGPWGAAQLRLLLTSLKITGFLAAGQTQNATDFKAQTQAFGFFQRMLQKASASCIDGYSQDLEHNPQELVKVYFTPYEIIVSVILLNIKGYS